MMFLLLACMDMPELHFNEPPVAGEVRFSPENPRTTDDLVVEVVAHPSDPEDDVLTVRTDYYINEFYYTPFLPLIVDSDSTEKGDLVRVELVATDGEWSSEVWFATVLVENTPPELHGVDLGPDSPLTTDVLTVTWDSTDADGDDVILQTVWTRDGQEVGSLTNHDSVPATQTTAGEVWEVTLTPFDGEDAGEPLVLGTRVENTLPTLGAAFLTNTTPRIGESVGVTWSGVEDADGDPVTIDVDWWLNGSSVEQDVVQNDTVAYLNTPFVKGDTVQAHVQVSDPYGVGDSDSTDVVLVLNTAPTLTSADLDPTEGTEETVFTCTPVGPGDVDGDTVSFDYAWSVNSSTVSDNDEQLDGSSFDKHDVIQCTVTPTDGSDNGASVATVTATVVNTAPSMTGASLTPTTATVQNTVTVTASGWVDVDGDNEGYTYAWSVDGSSISNSGSTLNLSPYDRGDTVDVTVTPHDGEEAGSSVSASTLTIANAKPVTGGGNISPSQPGTEDNLTVSVGSWSDADGDSAQWQYQWRIGASEISGATDSTLDSSETTRGDKVYVEITPYDGIDTGSSVVVGPRIIKNTTPVALAESLSSPPVEQCDYIELDATGSTDVDGDSLSYTWSVTARPTASHADSGFFDDTTSSQPLFLVDASGSYTFLVSVTDGGSGSDGDTVTVTTTTRSTANTDPVVDIVDPGTVSDTVTCGGSCPRCSTTIDLDGSGTTDADGDPMSYDWDVTALDGGYAYFDDDGAQSPTLNISSLYAYKNQTRTYEFEITMTATDCALGDDEVTVYAYVECTGS